jgi:sugar phosphate isomerase/epimerase
MIQLSIGSWAFGIYATAPTPFTTMLDRLAAIGFEGVEFGAFAPHPSPETVVSRRDRHALRAEFADRRLGISAIAVDFGGASLLSTDDHEAYLNAFDRNLEFCSDLGVSLLRVDSVESPELVAEIGFPLAARRAVEVWRECAHRAHAAGVAMTWEFEPSFAFNQPSQVLEIAHTLAGPGFGVLYDTAHAHMVSEVGARHAEEPELLEGGQLELLQALQGTINHVRMLDSNGTLHDAATSEDRTTVHVPFGEGQVDFDAVIPRIVEANPDVEWWCLDLCFWPADPWETAEEARRIAEELRSRYGSPTHQMEGKTA